MTGRSAGLSIPWAGQEVTRRELTWLAALAGGACGWLAMRSWLLGIGFLLALGASLWLVRFPLVCWCLLMLCLMLPMSHLPPPISAPLLWWLILLFVCGGWLAPRRVADAGAVADRRLVWWIVLWMAWMGLSALHSLAPLASLKAFGRYLLSFAALGAYLRWVQAPGQIRALVGWWYAVSVLAAVLCVGDGILPGGIGGVRFLGPHPPTQTERGIFFAALIPVVLSLRTARQAFNARPHGLALLALWVALMLSGSRAAVIAGVAGTAALAFAQHPWRTARWLAVVAVAAAGAVLLWAWRAGVGQDELLRQLSGRHLVWGAALRAIGAHPILGIGPGSWGVWLGRHFVNADFLLYDRAGNSFYLDTTLPGEAHSLFLTKAAEMGLPAMVGLLGLFTAWSRLAARASRALTDGWDAALVRGCCASLWGLMALCLFENGPILGNARGGEVVIVWLVAALPLVLGRLSRAAGGQAPG